MFKFSHLFPGWKTPNKGWWLQFPFQFFYPFLLIYNIVLLFRKNNILVAHLSVVNMVLLSFAALHTVKKTLTIQSARRTYLICAGESYLRSKINLHFLIYPYYKNPNQISIPIWHWFLHSIMKCVLCFNNSKKIIRGIISKHILTKPEGFNMHACLHTGIFASVVPLNAMRIYYQVGQVLQPGYQGEKLLICCIYKCCLWRTNSSICTK